MTEDIAKNRISKIFYGSIIWAIFYHFVFYNPSAWNQETILGQILSIQYQLELMIYIKIIFFLLIGLHLYKTTLAKKNSFFSFNRLMNIFLIAAFIRLLIYGLTNYIIQDNHTLGIFTYLYNVDANVYQSNTFLIYQLGLLLELFYILMIIIYIYQLKKSFISLSFLTVVRLMVILGIYISGLYLSAYSDLQIMSLLIGLAYLFIGFMVYIKTRYSLLLSLICIALLLII